VTPHGWRTGGEVKGKLVNVVASQYPSHYLGTWCIQHYYRWCAHLGCASTLLNWRPPTPADLNGLVRFTERRNLVSARVPSHFNCPLRVVTFRKWWKHCQLTLWRLAAPVIPPVWRIENYTFCPQRIYKFCIYLGEMKRAMYVKHIIEAVLRNYCCSGKQ